MSDTTSIQHNPNRPPAGQPSQLPQVGDDVLFVLDDRFRHPGEARPAKIVKVWSHAMVNLAVFLDGQNDLPASVEGEGLVALQLVAWQGSASLHLGPEDAPPASFYYPANRPT